MSGDVGCVYHLGEAFSGMGIDSRAEPESYSRCKPKAAALRRFVREPAGRFIKM